MRRTAARLTVEHRLSARRPLAISIMDGRLRNGADSRDLARLMTSVRARSADVHVHSVLLSTRPGTTTRTRSGRPSVRHGSIRHSGAQATLNRDGPDRPREAHRVPHRFRSRGAPCRYEKVRRPLGLQPGGAEGGKIARYMRPIAGSAGQDRASRRGVQLRLAVAGPLPGVPGQVPGEPTQCRPQVQATPSPNEGGSEPDRASGRDATEVE
jgi:hypothetical protein